MKLLSIVQYLICLLSLIIPRYAFSIEQERGVCEITPTETCTQSGLPKSPLTLLEQLKSNRVVNFHSKVKGYVKAEHLKDLFKLLDSTERSGYVECYCQSNISLSEYSTLGDQAGYLINSFITGVYPNTITTLSKFSNKQELENWYKKYLTRDYGVNN